MLGIALKVDETDKFLEVDIDPSLLETNIDAKALFNLVSNSEYSNFFIFDEDIINVISNCKNAKANHDNRIITKRIGERRDSDIKCTIREDELSASLTLTCGYAGKPVTTNHLIAHLRSLGITRGISTKRLSKLAYALERSSPGDKVKDVVAIGLPPKAGRSSKLHPLVQNALERILTPQTQDGERVDMRNLGAVICVKKGTHLLRRLPPTEGRKGFTIKGTKIKPKPGEWVKFRPGPGTVISPNDENLLLADITGMPKFKGSKMWIDDVYVCKGVNVGTGNIEYDGAVLVNGDVTENMKIIATGDVTVNGFVESAYIQTTGDIIITEGAMGKVNDELTEYSCNLISQGSVHIQHGQGLNIKCHNNVTIGRQLAHSKIDTKGKVTIGSADNPNGNIFACKIKCGDQFSAGTIGAVSGSNLSIDYSEMFNTLVDQKDTLDDLLKQLSQNNLRHMERMNIINSKFVPKDMQSRVDEANQLYQGETQLLNWLHQKATEMNRTKERYQANIKMIASKKVYPGVTLKLNNRTWRAEKELDRSQVTFEHHQWQCVPIVGKLCR